MKTITYNPETHVLVPKGMMYELPELPMPIKGKFSKDLFDGFQMHQYAMRYLDEAIAAAPQPEPVSKRQYYFKNNNCKANSAHDPDCICWHDEGTGPMLPCIDGEYLVKMTWRNIAQQPEPVESEPVAWCLAYDDPNLKLRIHSNPTMCEAEIDAHVNRLNGALSKAPLYTTPQPDRVAELEAALKVARDNIHSAKLCEVNSMSSRHEMLRLMNNALAKINEVLKP